MDDGLGCEAIRRPTESLAIGQIVDLESLPAKANGRGNVRGAPVEPHDGPAPAREMACAIEPMKPAAPVTMTVLIFYLMPIAGGGLSIFKSAAQRSPRCSQSDRERNAGTRLVVGIAGEIGHTVQELLPDPHQTRTVGVRRVVEDQHTADAQSRGDVAEVVRRTRDRMIAVDGDEIESQVPICSHELRDRLMGVAIDEGQGSRVTAPGELCFHQRWTRVLVVSIALLPPIEGIDVH